MLKHCSQRLRRENKPNPRTCEVCGLGPCQFYPSDHANPDQPLAAPAPPKLLPTLAEAGQAVRTLIHFIGDDPDRPGLRETPDRFLRAWITEWGAGYGEDSPNHLVKMFKEEGQSFDEIVIVRKIRFWSHCEHHLAPFFGTADVGYLPNPLAGIIGLSKIPRIVEHFARRLQVQERIGAQVADFIMERVAARGVGVILRARHLCMCSRGVAQDDVEAITSTLRGMFQEPRAQAEFLQLTRG